MKHSLALLAAVGALVATASPLQTQEPVGGGRIGGPKGGDGQGPAGGGRGGGVLPGVRWT